MKRGGLAVVLASLVSGCATVPPAPPPPRPLSNVVSDNSPPRLIVAIAVDQFSADLFDEYRGSFTSGLARLAGQGVAFRNGYQSHSITEACLGHSTMLTGMHPAHTGIIGNTWYQPASPRGRQPIYCAEDESKIPAKYDPANYVVSPIHLKVPVLGELLKAVSPRSQSVAVAGKDRAAVMMGGHTPDVRWYYRTRGETAKFESDLPGAVPTPAVEAVNAHIASEIAQPAAAMAVPADCERRDKPITLEGGLVVGNGRFARGPGQGPYHSSAALDADTVDLATALVDERQLGRDGAPDVLAVSLSATDYIGHSYGTEGLEMCIQMHALDEQVGRLLNALDSRGIDYAVVLTADHGGTDIPERLRLAGNSLAEREPDTLGSKTIGAKIAEQLHLGENPLIGDGDIYLAPGLDAATRARVMDMTIAAYRAIPEVAAVYAGTDLAKVPVPTGDPTKFTLEQRARASFDPERSGDIIVQLKRWVVPIAHPGGGYVATHGSPWDNDRRVPILFWRKGMAPESRDDPADTVDILPTLAAMLGLPVTETIDGRCLTGISGVACPR